MPDAARARALRHVAQRWTDPEHPPRAEAVAETLAADNRFTEESLAFAVNHAADLVASGGLDAWLGEAPAGEGSVAVIARGRTPLDGFFAAAATVASGCRARLAVSAASPALVAAFLDEVGAEVGEEVGSVVAEAQVMDGAVAVIARGNDAELASWRSRATDAGIPDERMVLVPEAAGVAVLDGSEDREALSGLAEDVLLHEGGTPESVRVVFAPAELEPDPLLEALAGFRELHPPHSGTDGSLAMQAGFLGAAKAPHAVGPGFLVSKNDEPEPQGGAHLRWTPYSDLDEVVQRIGGGSIAFVAATQRVIEELRQRGLDASVPVIGFGDAHRPVPGQPPLVPDVPALLARLGRG
jgi:hypothetical protein